MPKVLSSELQWRAAAISITASRYATWKEGDYPWGLSMGQIHKAQEHLGTSIIDPRCKLGNDCSWASHINPPRYLVLSWNLHETSLCGSVYDKAWYDLYVWCSHQGMEKTRELCVINPDTQLALLIIWGYKPGFIALWALITGQTALHSL